MHCTFLYSLIKINIRTLRQHSVSAFLGSIDVFGLK